jgi:CelD/BcsL family acetyltransferase involved in cellulose biosynthesis
MSQGPASIAVDLAPARDCAGLEQSWRGLETRADGSFFLGWRWIGAWLAELPSAIEPLCLRARAGGETVGLALLTPRAIRRRGLIASRQLHLNATGQPSLDQLTIEHNGFLLDRRLAAEAGGAMLDCLAAHRVPWDELFLDGVAPSWLALLDRLRGIKVIRQHSVCPYVDLTALQGADGLSGIGPNTRQQIRRMYRLSAGPVLEQAAGAAEGLEYLDRLAALHQAQWESRGHPGAFGSDFLAAFHRRLVAEGAASGAVQLLRLRAGDGRPLGYLYNFVHRDRVYAYQSGFPSLADNRIKPGLLGHHMAILKNRGDGLSFYDFLAGDSRYKRSLSNRQEELIWVVVQRPAVRFAIERGFRRLKAHLRPEAGRGAS